MQNMGELSSRQLKEGMQIFTELAEANKPVPRPKRISFVNAKSFNLAMAPT